MTDLQYHVRWMIKRDLVRVMAIERVSFEFQWSEEEFRNYLRTRNCIGLVVECDEQVVGYAVCELLSDRIHVLNFAVAPEWRRRGVGRQLVAKLKEKLSAHRRTRLVLEVRERNLDAQRFFRAMGFRAVAVLRGHYHDSPEDAYVFRYRVQASDECREGQIEEAAC